MCFASRKSTEQVHLGKPVLRTASEDLLSVRVQVREQGCEEEKLREKRRKILNFF